MGWRTSHFQSYGTWGMEWQISLQTCCAGADFRRNSHESSPGAAAFVEDFAFLGQLLAHGPSFLWPGQGKLRVWYYEVSGGFLSLMAR